MSLIGTEFKNHVAILTLNRGVTNALNLTLLQELDLIIGQVKQNAEVHSLVLSSANEKFFCIGFDIPALFGLSRAEFQIFYTTFNQVCLDLFTFPKPTMAAIPGHAIAGGCILTLCCDYRFIAEGRKLMGVNEIKLGVPVPYPADCILRHLVGFRKARQIMDYGDLFPAATAVELGLIDQILPLQEVLSGAIEKIELVGSYPPDAFAMIKKNRVESIEAQIRAHLNEKQEYFLDCWYSAATRPLLQKAMEKF
ncbi:enoyl-CoA hydratase/isomerase family protein [candidate division CSSED10-310 bacterium]|uniref:Enoyl-CoA hydratase/isomerase family protein n=1 Tax=candidate division CSSED10-310 bacterium TaxID=2855610 RepID=A0ABV6YZ60_UNCC1